MLGSSYGEAQITTATRFWATPAELVASTRQPVGVDPVVPGVGKLSPTCHVLAEPEIAFPPPVARSPALHEAVASPVRPAPTLTVLPARTTTLVAPLVPLVPLVPFVPGAPVSPLSPFAP